MKLTRRRRTRARNYIGLACSIHDASLAIVNAEGQVMYAENAERWLQDKRAVGCPADSINRVPALLERYCDPDAELVVAKTWGSDRLWPERLMAKGLPLLKRLLAFGSLFRRRPCGPLEQESAVFADASFYLPSAIWQIQAHVISLAGWGMRVQNLLPVRGLRHPVTFRRLDHHLAHAAAACRTSPFSDAVCAIVDGFGNMTSTSYYHYRDGQLERLKGVRQRSLGTLGLFYAWVCELCGFDSWKGEEWKVMGLAPYGEFDERAYRILRPLIGVKGLRLFSRYSTRGFDVIRRRPDQPPIAAANLAYTGQLIFEEILTQLLCNLKALGVSENLIYGGGCALNSAFNGKILQKTGFKGLHVYSAPADDGCALGAALQAYHDDHPQAVVGPRVHTPYLGSTMAGAAGCNLARFGPSRRSYARESALYQATARLLAKGMIVGWVQGRAEFGPRALGNRSILADPRASTMKDRINARVKFREEFRPFAPAILHEYGEEYFEDYQFSPYMERTLRFRPEMTQRVPAVVHVDGTGRLQSVTRELNERFYELIYQFHKLTGVPIVLNTSFNIMGKPIIHSVEDAVATLYTTGLDALVLGDDLILKEETRAHLDLPTGINPAPTIAANALRVAKRVRAAG